MSAITIKDLPLDVELDRKAMLAVRGGMLSMARAQASDPIRWTSGEPARSILGNPISPIGSYLGLLP